MFRSRFLPPSPLDNVLSWNFQTKKSQCCCLRQHDDAKAGNKSHCCESLEDVVKSCIIWFISLLVEAHEKHVNVVPYYSNYVSTLVDYSRVLSTMYFQIAWIPCTTYNAYLEYAPYSSTTSTSTCYLPICMICIGQVMLVQDIELSKIRATKTLTAPSSEAPAQIYPTILLLTLCL